MICNTCGRQTANEGANFCENCGASFRENVTFYEQVKPMEDRTTTQKESSPNDHKSMSVLKWLGFLCSIYIPYVGPFVYLGILLKWSIKSDVNPNQKNWARATLIFGIITIVIFMFSMATIMSGFLESGVSLEEYFINLYSM